MKLENKRGKDITAIYKDVKWQKINDSIEFEEAYDFLTNKKYHSSQAEKKRNIHKSFTIDIYRRTEETMKTFQNVVLSFINVFTKIETFDKISDVTSISTKDNFIKVESLPNDMFFRTTYIENDTVYTDEFYIYPKGNRYKLKVRKVIILPITRDPMSQYTYTSGWELRRKWKRYKNEIMKGIHI